MSLYVENERLKCNTCDLDVSTDKFPKGVSDLTKIRHECPNVKKVGSAQYNRSLRPNMVKRAITFAKASAEHIKAGHKQTSEELQKLRLDICNSCEHGDNTDCYICGCNIPKKVAWAEQKCPLGKWPTQKRMKDLLYRNKEPANLRNSFYNAGCFFLGAGPSLNDLDLGCLKNRGILTFGVNNVGAYNNIRPNFWCSADDPKSFHQAIWNDPGIMKFVKEVNYRKIPAPPNCYVFEFNEDFDAKTFFTEPTINFGCRSELYDAYGQKGGRSVMYCALRIIHYLGFKRLYLLGCDFNMREDKQYAFDQHKWKGGISTNNQHYKIMNVRFKHLDGEAKKHGFKIYNCTPNSGLTAFEQLSFEEAYKKELIETPKSLANMYDGPKS